MSLIAAAWAAAATAAALFVEPLWARAGLTGFWLILAASGMWTTPALLWTVSAVAAKTRSRAFVSPAVNSLRPLPIIVLFGAATPYPMAALLAAILNITYVFASLKPGSRRRPLAFAAALGIEGGLALRLIGEPLLSAIAAAFGIAAFLWLLPGPNARTSWLRSAASIAMAVMLASGLALLARLSALAPAAAAPDVEAAAPADTRDVSAAQVRSGGVEEIGQGRFAGVILWPEEGPTTTIVAPLTVWTQASIGYLGRKNSFPFSGEYWFFKPPSLRPPRESVVKRGKPTRLAFRSTDDLPLFMEARQRLPLPVALSCCSAIEMEIENLDRRAGSIVLEMFLFSGESRISLGERAAAGRVLRWEMPRTAAIRQFDEIAILFHREPKPTGFSASLAIERFVLIP